MTLIKQTNTIFSKLFLTIFVSLSIFNAIFAADGDLDLSFNGTGIVNTEVGNGGDRAEVSLIQNDGKILVVGNSSLFGSGSPFYFFDGKGFAFARYNVDGSLDSTFNGSGKSFVNLGSRLSSTVYAASIQANGKILAVGNSEYSVETAPGTRDDFTIVRLEANGSVDKTFGENGIVRTQIGSYSRAKSIAVQADGKIIVGGFAYVNNNAYRLSFAIVRYNENGSIDSSFGTNGIVTTINENNDESVHSLAIQSDGKILAAINSGILRLDSDGSLDLRFGRNGKISLQPEYKNRELSIQADGKIIVSGSAGLQTVNTVSRYDSNGTLDTSFDGDGVANISGDLWTSGLEIQGDGKIVVANSMSISRLNADGSVDTTFGNGGRYFCDEYYRILPFFSVHSISSVSIQSDGKLVITMLQGLSRGGDFIVGRHNTNGTLDTSFDSDGVVTTSGFAGNSKVNSMVLQPDGKIVAVGTTDDGLTPSNFDVVRYNSNGTLDNSFGLLGKVSTLMGTGFAKATFVALQPDGKIVVAGHAEYRTDIYRTVFALTRYNQDGSLDVSFGEGGRLYLQNKRIPRDFLPQILVQADGKIFLISTYVSNLVVRLLPDGRLDSEFGDSGILFPAENSGFSKLLKNQSDGKLLILGTSISNQTDPPTYSYEISRYNANGTKDATYGTNGVLPLVKIPNVSFFDVKIQPDGRFLAATASYVLNQYNYSIARYNADGSIDNTFNGNGLVSVTFGNGTTLKAIEIQADGKIIAAGTFESELNTSSIKQFAATRFNPDGSLDSTFDGDGKVATQFNEYGVDLTSILVQPNGKILLGGQIGYTFGLVRYQGTPVAQNVAIGGLVSNSSGRAIRNVTLQITGGNLTQPKIARTNSFGYYRFQDLEVGQTYVVSIAAKRYTFANPSRVITLNENLDSEDFMSEGK
jgi:uncharacterized delta-60 repeat protein